MYSAREAAEFWDKSCASCFQVCIDGYCPTCHFNKECGTAKSALRFMTNCPVKRLQIHCFLIDIPNCLAALSERGTLQQLSLAITHQSDSPLLENVLSTHSTRSSIHPQGFSQLKELVLDSSHLNHVRLEGRAQLLDFMGQSLEHLSFRNLSPSGVFSILEDRCPRLKYLRVDRAQTLPDLLQYHNPLLEELELRRCNFIFESLKLPGLKRLRFSASFRMQLSHVKAFISATPKTISDLSVEVPSSLVNQLIVLVSRHLHDLQHLTLEGAYDTHAISSRALGYLGSRCKSLKSIQLRHAKSVNALSFQSAESIDVLRTSFPNLSLLRMRFDEVFIDALRKLLAQSSCMNQLTLWQRKRWKGIEKWNIMEMQVAALRESFPNVKITLENV